MIRRLLKNCQNSNDNDNVSTACELGTGRTEISLFKKKDTALKKC